MSLVGIRQINPVKWPMAMGLEVFYPRCARFQVASGRQKVDIGTSRIGAPSFIDRSPQQEAGLCNAEEQNGAGHGTRDTLCKLSRYLREFARPRGEIPPDLWTNENKAATRVFSSPIKARVSLFAGLVQRNFQGSCRQPDHVRRIQTRALGLSAAFQSRRFFLQSRAHASRTALWNKRNSTHPRKQSFEFR